MEIVLEHFRCFTNVRAIFPSRGIILLNGPSGIGKSTLFKAIHFALYGKEQKVVQFGQKKAKVTLKTNVNDKPLFVSRSTNPSNLTVTYEGQTYTKDAAQALIKDLFGGYFCQTSYLSQKSVENFLSLSQAERTSFLEACNESHQPIQNLKDACKNKIKDRKAALLKAQTEMNTLLPLYSSAPELPVYPYPEKPYEQECQERECNETKLSEARTELTNCNKMQALFCAQQSKKEMVKKELDECKAWLIANPIKPKVYNKAEIEDKIKQCKQTLSVWDQLEQYQQSLNTLNSLKQQRLAELERYKSNLIIVEECEIKELESELNSQQKLLSKLQEWNKLLDDPIDCFSEEPVEDLVAELNLQIKACDDDKKEYDPTPFREKIQQSQTKCSMLEKDIIACKEACKGKQLKCPSCTSSLSLQHNILVCFDQKKEQEKLSDLENELKSETKKYQLLLKECKVCEEESKQIDFELAACKKALQDCRSYQNKNCKEITDLSERLKIARQQYADMVTCKAEIERCRKPSKAEQKCQDQVNIYSGITKPEFPRSIVVEQLSTYQNEFALACEEEANVANLDKKHKEFNKKISSYTDFLNEPSLQDQSEAINALTETISKRTTREEKFKKRSVKIQAYFQAEKEYRSMLEGWNRLVKAKADCARWEQALLVAEKGYNCLTEAESISLMQTLNTINLELDQFTSSFFDNKLSISLKSWKETSKGEKRNCIDLNISREGEDVSIDSLSGGEYDRCVLALFLAFNLVHKSKWLMLDECLSSLHAEAVEDILEYIKDKWSSQLVLVTLHQANTGMFDQVVDVCCLRN